MVAASEFDGTAAVASSSQKVSVGRQVLRRELNDRLRARYLGEREFAVFCECGRAGCRDEVVVTPDRYETLRRAPTHFLIKRSHAGPAENVVETCDDFLIVEKLGRSGLAR
ncbi:MAG: hypothetical protein H0V68_06835 [Actinobacteria bacterium]|nr:hypothetical protein [Actinomycetota bacterium]